MSRLRGFLTVFIALLLAARPLAAESRFKPTQLILPGALIAVGAWGVSDGWLRDVSRDVRHGMQHLSGGHTLHIDDGLRYVPLAGYLALGSIGVPGRHNLRDRALIAAGATASMLAITQPVKWAVKERRPGAPEECNSFPSGHTAVAFMGAELLRSEYEWYVGLAGYTVAGGVAFLRLYNDRHWLNDVVAGAGVGILSARIGEWLLPVWHRLFKLDHGPTGAVMPTYDPSTRCVGLAAALTF